MKNFFIILAFFLFVFPAFAHQSDSLEVTRLKTRMEKVEAFQENVEKALENKFDQLSNKQTKAVWIFGILLALGIGSVVKVYKNIEKTVDDKIRKKFDNIITEKEGDILALIDRQSRERQFVKNKKVLVLTAKSGDDTFLRKFFKAMGFPIDHVNYIKADSYEKTGKYDLIFANNEKGDLPFELISAYFEKSDPKTVLFYFNSTRKFYTNEKVENRLSFANARTQIYGNLMNLFSYQKVL